MSLSIYTTNPEIGHITRYR